MRITIPASAILGFAMCLSTPLTAGPRDVPAPCGLVTRTEVRALLGAAIISAVESERIKGDPSRTCVFRSANGKTLNLYVGAKTKADFEVEKAGKHPVAAVGDDAYLNPPNIITLRKGSRGASVQAMGFDAARDASLIPNLRTLARALARRL